MLSHSDTALLPAIQGHKEKDFIEKLFKLILKMADSDDDHNKKGMTFTLACVLYAKLYMVIFPS